MSKFPRLNFKEKKILQEIYKLKCNKKSFEFEKFVNFERYQRFKSEIFYCIIVLLLEI